MRDEYVIMLYGDGMKLETNLKQTKIQKQKLSLKQQFSLKVLEMNDTPVSYTHLDVYKRQPYGDRTFRWGGYLHRRSDP